MTHDTQAEFGVRGLLKQGWNIAFGPGYRTLVGLSFLWLLLWATVLVAGELLDRQLAYSGIVISLLLEPLVAGFPFAVVGLVRGQQLQLEGMFSGLPQYGKLLLYGILFRIILFVPIGLMMLPLVRLGELFPHPVAIIIILLVFGIVWIGVWYLAVRLSFTKFAIMDTRGAMSVNEAIKASWQLTAEPVGSRVFLLGLTLGFISVLATCLLVLPLFFIAVPLSLVTWALAYDQAVARQPRDHTPHPNAEPVSAPPSDPATAPAALWTKP